MRKHTMARSRRFRLPISPSLIIGHLTVDTYMNLLSGLLPILSIVHGLSYLFAGILAMVSNLTSSVVQPILGRWFDRTQVTWLMEVGLLLDCIGMSLIGISPNYTILLFLVGTAGLGHAAFHPAAFTAVVRSSSSGKGGATGVFLSAGNVGWFLGPILAGGLVSFFGLWSTILLLPFGLVVTLFLFKTRAGSKGGQPSITKQPGSVKRGVLTLFVAIATFRSFATASAMTFLPIYFVAKGGSLFFATSMTSIWLALAVLGQISGGYISDHFEKRTVISGSLFIGTALFYGFLATTGLLSLILLALSGMFLYGSWTVLVAMSYQASPGNVGSVSGLMLGLSIGVGGLGAAAFGAAADVIGLDSAFYFAMAFPVVAGILSLFLPRQSGRDIAVP